MPRWRACTYCGADFALSHSNMGQAFCNPACATHYRWRQKPGAPTWAEQARALARGLLEIAELAMPDTYFQTDSRCILAREVLGGSTQ